jgi:alkylation response protein AidB-like acyl-CoA dehydrogenase
MTNDDADFYGLEQLLDDADPSISTFGGVHSGLAMGSRGRACAPGLAQLQADGAAADEHSALAKAFCTVRMRETVGYARELLGGNGILLEHQVGRFVADAEAIYSYEGIREINTLVVGRAITGLSAFV